MAERDMSILEAAVEVTKAALPTPTGTWINNPEAVGQFIEVVYQKLLELENRRYGQFSS